MRKRILGTIAAAAAAVFMLSGFESPMTVSELQEKTALALAEVDSMTATILGNVHSYLTIAQGGEDGESMDIPISGMVHLDFKMNLEPFLMEAGISYDADAMGQGTDGHMGIYILENDTGTADAYLGTRTDDAPAEWDAQILDAQNLETIKEGIHSVLTGDLSVLDTVSEGDYYDSAADLKELIDKYRQVFEGMMQVAPEKIKDGDKEYYVLTGDIAGDTLEQYLEEFMAAAGQSPDELSLNVMQTLMSSLKMNMEIKIDAQTYLPASYRFDLGGSDFGALADMILESILGPQSGATAKLDVSAAELEGRFLYNIPVTVSVPEEALDATGGIGGSDGGDDISVGTDDVDTGDGVRNPDGSYHLKYEGYQTTAEADITVPEGLRLSYGSENYVSFTNDDYSVSVSYSLFSTGTPQETVEDDLDVSYMESNSDYSDVSRSEVLQTSLPDGTPVYYGHKRYTYNGFRLGGTECALQAGDSVVDFEIQIEDGSLQVMDASEEDVLAYAACVKR